VREVAFLDVRHSRHLAMRAGEVLDDLASHTTDSLAPSLSRPRRGAAYVVLGDPAAWSRPADPAELDPDFLGHLPDRRRRLWRSARSGVSPDHHEERSDRHHLALADEDLRNLAAGRR